ncbi:MAG TPA: DNA polymerase III subunit chi [Geminicoccus sp.]|uniref:DNA polymerase III subunit chi n=1 Tax=Geminicoccus sp. TaxID=2024832 RepID=UPI002E33108F|nr:DNA polymerase III subunit chi [Geminicoccus sp.]HEX2527488.1 DNA polymerase III subunit chi [Geminicoccus sp.]
MSEVGFYHLTRSSLEEALPRLLAKALAAPMRVLLRASSRERVEALDRHLWVFEADSWLPHGTRADGNPDMQPVWLTDQVENPNEATLLVLVDQAADDDMAAFPRVLDLFDGADEAAVEAARERWRQRRAAGHRLVYWKQTERGGWEKAREEG